MQKKKILAMLLSAMIVMSMATVSAFAYTCDSHNWSNGSCTNTNPENPEETCDATHECDNDGATCTTPGTCSICGATGTINLANHDMQNVEAKGATCTETGYNAHLDCSRCEFTSGKEIIPIDADAHAYGDWTSNGDGTHTRTCSNNNEHTENGNCDTNGDGGACSICGYKAPVEPECTHEETLEYIQVGDTQHKQECTADGCEYETTAVNCTDKGDGTCVCGRTMASQEPGEEKTAITEVNLRMGNFEVGGTLPTVGAEEANVNYTIDHKWFKNGKEVSDPATIEADKYTCQITLTAKEGYTFKGLTIATFPGFTKQPTQPLTVSEDGSEATTSVIIDKSDKKEESGSGSTGGSSSSSSSTTTKPAVDTKAETDKIAKAEEGSKVSVKIEGTTVPADYIKTAMESKATVVVDYGSYAWEISDVKTAKAVDLSISRYIMPKTVLNTVKGDNSNVISIKHDGDLGFKGTLKYNVKKANAGKFVNLYYYNLKTKKLELQGSTKIGADGNVFLPFTHCSIYVLNITDKAASNELFEDFSAGESATVVEETLPAVTNAPAATEAPATTDAAANPETGNSAVALVAIPMAIAAAAVISKKR